MADLEKAIDDLGASALRVKAQRDVLAKALRDAYAILCAGKPPHSARESNARRVIRAALSEAGE